MLHQYDTIQDVTGGWVEFWKNVRGLTSSLLDASSDAEFSPLL
jgi:hypothetical protein